MTSDTVAMNGTLSSQQEIPNIVSSLQMNNVSILPKNTPKKCKKNNVSTPQQNTKKQQKSNFKKIKSSP